MLDALAIERILERYPHASALQRWHMRGRLKLCPYERLDRHLTGYGNLLDVGCGFGHLAWHLAAVKPDLRYFGTDVDERKIALARACPIRPAGTPTPAPMPPPPQFRLGDAITVFGLPETFGNIVFLDVLYLMPWKAQQRMLEWALGRLAPGPDSAVVIKTMDKAEGVSGFRALAEEWIMVSLLRRTMSSGALNGARSTGDYLDFASSMGFKSETESLGTFNPSTIIRMHR